MMDDKSQEKEFVAGLVIGAILGAGAAILLGTEEGKEIRQRLIKKSQGILADLPELVSDLGTRTASGKKLIRSIAASSKK